MKLPVFEIRKAPFFCGTYETHESHRTRIADSESRISSERRGVVLIAVLIVVAILMLVGYTFHRWMIAEAEAAAVTNRLAQGRQLADSGLHYAAFVLAQPAAAGADGGEGSAFPAPGLVHDNANLFHRRQVASPNALPGYFSIVVPRDFDDPQQQVQPYRFGVQDESGKININTLLRRDPSGRQAREQLMKLPEMNQEIADALINWTRKSTEPSDSTSADAMYYADRGYTLKYGPYESPEELLLIRGMTPRLYLGNDQNRNGLLEPEEDDRNGVLDPGLSRYLTIYSRERNVDSLGQPRINVNDSDLRGLHEKLVEAVGEELANWIVAYRLYARRTDVFRIEIRAMTDFTGIEVNLDEVNLDVGTVLTDVSLSTGYVLLVGQQQGDREEVKIVDGSPKLEDADFERQPQQNISSLYQLIGSEVEISRRNAEGRRETTRYRSPLQKEDVDGLSEDLPAILDKLTATQEQELSPRININTAPREVLMTLPNVTEADVQVILDHQPGPDLDSVECAIYRTPAWLITEAGFSVDVVQSLEPYITTQSQVYRMQVVGYYGTSGPMVRLEAVVDANGGRPKILYWRDITELGRGFDLRGR